MSGAPGPSERQFQAAVIEYAKLNGWLVYHTHDSRRSAAGFPDLVLCRPPRLVLAELKKGHRTRPTQAQCRWLRELNRCSGVEAHLWRPGDWASIEETLRSEVVVRFRRRAVSGPEAPTPPGAA